MRQFLAAALLGSALVMSVSAAFAADNRPVPQQSVAILADVQMPGHSASSEDLPGVPDYTNGTSHIQNQ